MKTTCPPLDDPAADLYDLPADPTAAMCDPFEDPAASLSDPLDDQTAVTCNSLESPVSVTSYDSLEDPISVMCDPLEDPAAKMRNHPAIVHTETTCDLCNVSVQSNYFIEHLKQIHKIVQSPCPICQKKPLKIKYLAEHLKLKHNILSDSTKYRDDSNNYENFIDYDFTDTENNKQPVNISSFVSRN